MENNTTNYLERLFIIRSYEVNEKLELKINVLAEWFSEIAWEHSKQLNLSFEDLQESDNFWVLISYEIKINKLPNWQDEVKLKTYPSGLNNFYFSREFILTDKNGIFLAGASSSWIILNKTTRKIVIPKGTFFSKYNYISDKVIPEKFNKLIAQKDLKNSIKIKSRYVETDMHHHINNAVYIAWIYEIIRSNCKIKKFRIQYIKELTADENIIINYDNRNNIMFFEGISENREISVFRAEVEIY